MGVTKLSHQWVGSDLTIGSRNTRQVLCGFKANYFKNQPEWMLDLPQTFKWNHHPLVPVDKSHLGLQVFMSSENVFVHPSSFVDEPCTMGDGTKIWHFCHIMAGAVLGRNCSLGQNVFVSGGAVLGDNVKVQNNVSIYDGVTLEDDTFCGPSLVFTNVINPRSHVSRKHEYQKTLVKKGATLGANATIVCGNTIGAYAMVGAGSVVTRDVPDFALAVGVPARVTGYLCRCGQHLGSISPSQTEKTTCRSCKTSYLMEDGRLEINTGQG